LAPLQSDTVDSPFQIGKVAGGKGDVAGLEPVLCVLREFYLLRRQFPVKHFGKWRVFNLLRRRFLRLRPFLPGRLNRVGEKDLIYHHYAPFTLMTSASATEAAPIFNI